MYLLVFRGLARGHRYGTVTPREGGGQYALGFHIKLVAAAVQYVRYLKGRTCGSVAAAYDGNDKLRRSNGVRLLHPRSQEPRRHREPTPLPPATPAARPLPAAQHAPGPGWRHHPSRNACYVILRFSVSREDKEQLEHVRRYARDAEQHGAVAFDTDG